MNRSLSDVSTLSLYVIGCGGIGGFLCNLLPQTLASLKLDTYEERRTRSMESAGEILKRGGLDADILSMGSLNMYSRLVLVDGDSFDLHNGLRQAGVNGSKLSTQMSIIKSTAAFRIWLKDTKLIGYNNYIKPSNTSKIITPAKLEDNKLTEFPVIFLCVDNHKTRYEVSRYAELLDDVLVINGGNNKTSGNVTIFERRHGENIDPNIFEIYPEVAAGNDKRPDETSCTDVAPENDQTAIVNNVVAAVMLGRFTAWWRKGLEEKTPKKDENGNNVYVRRNEVVFDLSRCTMQPLTRRKAEK